MKQHKKKYDWATITLWIWIVSMILLVLAGCYITYQAEVAWFTFHHL
jgi:hypothetical protein